ncbi:hypothetical protein LTR17_011870 [Elasticomyces elasticus]|nr:hypothetical protein LTR17_011870 [Elasticomyces elasticus]
MKTVAIDSELKIIECHQDFAKNEQVALSEALSGALTPSQAQVSLRIVPHETVEVTRQSYNIHAAAAAHQHEAEEKQKAASTINRSLETLEAMKKH